MCSVSISLKLMLFSRDAAIKSHGKTKALTHQFHLLKHDRFLGYIFAALFLLRIKTNVLFTLCWITMFSCVYSNM